MLLTDIPILEKNDEQKSTLHHLAQQLISLQLQQKKNYLQQVYNQFYYLKLYPSKRQLYPSEAKESDFQTQPNWEQKRLHHKQTNTYSHMYF